MPAGFRLYGKSFILYGFLIVFIGILYAGAPAEAAVKRFDKDLLKLISEFIKDREAAFRGAEAKPRAEAEKDYTAIASEIDTLYLGEVVKISTFGTGAKARNVLTHFLYLAFEAQRRKHELIPVPEKLVAGQPFLQELIVKGICYTRGETYPKKMKDLLAVNLGGLALMRLHLDSWDEKHRKSFDSTYPLDSQ